MLTRIRAYLPVVLLKIKLLGAVQSVLKEKYMNYKTMSLLTGLAQGFKPENDNNSSDMEVTWLSSRKAGLEEYILILNSNKSKLT